MNNGTKIVCNKTTKIRIGKVTKTMYRGMTALFSSVDIENKKINILIEGTTWAADPKDWEEL